MKPKAGQSKEDFLSECIPLVLDEGTAADNDQAVAMCNTMWDEGRSQRERRVFSSHELRAEGEANAPMIVGYIARFNSLSDDLGGFIEMIRPGAFAKTIQESDIRALWQHNPEMVLGRTKNGTLKLREDDVGLLAEITPPDTTWARDAVASIRRGDVDQASFGFDVVRDEWNWENRPNIRTLVEVKLFDVSPVTFPAYPATSMAVRQALAEHSGIPGQAPHLPDGEVGAEAATARARLAKMRRMLKVIENS